MKLFYVVVIVISVFVQSLFCSYDHQQTDASPLDRDESPVDLNFENKLRQRFSRKINEIVGSWADCKRIFEVHISEALDIFQNPPLDDGRQHVSRNVKCFVDCILRQMGLMSDNGLDDTEYMKQIRQLRYNYTSFDIHKKSSDAQQRIMDIISKRASDLPRYIARPIDFHDHFICRIYRKVFRNTCYELIQSYELAARNCKNLRASDDDRCETSWMIVRCMMQQNRKRFFDSPFYPIRLVPLQ